MSKCNLMPNNETRTEIKKSRPAWSLCFLEVGDTLYDSQRGFFGISQQTKPAPWAKVGSKGEANRMAAK